MANGHPAVVRRVRHALESNGVFEKSDEIQHATRMFASIGMLRASILVFNTGSVVVQGRVSPLEGWLRELKRSVEAGREVPPFV